MGDTLYDLTKNFSEALEVLETEGYSQEAIEGTIDALQGDWEEKAVNVIKYIKHLEGFAKMQKEESKTLAEKAKTTAARAESLMTYLDMQIRFMREKGVNFSHIGPFTVKYQKGRKSVEIDPLKLPPQYWVPSDPVPMSKPELKERLENGETIPGVGIVQAPDKLVIK